MHRSARHFSQCNLGFFDGHSAARIEEELEVLLGLAHGDAPVTLDVGEVEPEQRIGGDVGALEAQPGALGRGGSSHADECGAVALLTRARS